MNTLLAGRLRRRQTAAVHSVAPREARYEDSARDDSDGLGGGLSVIAMPRIATVAVHDTAAPNGIPPAARTMLDTGAAQIHSATQSTPVGSAATRRPDRIVRRGTAIRV